MHERERGAECKREEAQPVEEPTAREGDGVPLILAGEAVAVERDDEEVVQLVPNGAPESLHYRCDGSEGEGDDGLEDTP